MLSLIMTMRDFCGGLEYQLQFNDFRMLEQLEQEGESFFKFMNNCLQRERPMIGHAKDERAEGGSPP